MAREGGGHNLTGDAFANLFRVIDAATTSLDGSGAAAASAKRKRAATNGSSSDGQRPRTMGIAEWAKARADLHLDKKRNIEAAQRRLPLPPTSSLATPSSASSSPSSSGFATSYAPFSKQQLLTRIATFTLSTFNVRCNSRALVPTSIQADQRPALDASITSLARWLEPLGPALHGWSHLAPHQLITKRQQSIQERGAKNKLHCQTCDATFALPNSIDGAGGLAQLFDQVKELQDAHEQWCPWRRRPCDQRLYHVGGHGSEAGHRNLVVAAASKYKARKRCLETAQEIEEAAREAGWAGEVTAPQDAEDVAHAVAAVAALATGGTATPPSGSSITLAIFGWEADVGKRCIACTMCGRRVNLSTKATRIDAVGQHRSFCPWIQAATQAGGYLPRPPAADCSDDDEASLVQRLQDNAVAAQSSDLPTAQQPGWRLTLTKLLDHKRGVGGVGEGDASVTVEGAQAGGEASTVDSVASTVSSASSTSTTTTRGQKTSDILRTARSMLFGAGHRAARP